MKHTILLCVVLLAVSACGASPEQEAAQTATAMTATAEAWTPISTATSTATIAPSPTATETPLPSATPTATLQPTATTPPTPTQDPNRYYAADNSFSVVSPEGWQIADLGLKYQSLLGPVVENVTQNVVFVSETSTVPMAMYAAFVQDNITASIEDVKSIQEEFLSTSQGIDYFHWTIELSQQGTRMRQAYYIVENGDWKLTIIYTRQAGEAPDQDAVVDAMIDTLQFSEE